MPQLVGMEILNIIPLFKFLEIAGWALRVHWISRIILGKHPFTNTLACLFSLQPPQKSDYLQANINRARLSVLRCVNIDASGWCVLEIAADGNAAALKVNIRPLEAASLTSSHSGISNEIDICLPFKRFSFQTFKDVVKLLDGIGFVAFLFVALILLNVRPPCSLIAVITRIRESCPPWRINVRLSWRINGCTQA